MDTIVQLISTVGFPIVMCGIMGYYVKYTHDDHREDIKRLQEEHKKETENFKEALESIVTALNNNTKAMERIFDLKSYEIEEKE